MNGSEELPLSRMLVHAHGCVSTKTDEQELNPTLSRSVRNGGQIALQGASGNSNKEGSPRVL
jgi:hypothetical protein